MKKIIEQIVRLTTDGNETRAEVVGEITRCANCAFCETIRFLEEYATKCELLDKLVDDEWFCADGERKETEDAEIH